MSDAAITFALYGTTRTEPAPRSLKAGKLEAQLSGGQLRFITYDGIEVLRAISYLVRDRDWGTYDPALSDLEVDESADAFAVRYSARCIGPDGAVLDITASITGHADGRLSFLGTAASSTGFETNRCGFCILHPIAGLAGAPVLVEHVDGTVEDTRLPDLIEPWQPFKDMRAIIHTAASGIVVECRMEGDTFEMEDQRNWSDASYKTYVRPLAFPWPYEIAVGQPVEQQIVVSITDTRKQSETTSACPQAEDVVTILVGESSGTLPNIGLIVTPEEAAATLEAAEILAKLGAQELIFHYDPLAGHNQQALEDFAAIQAVQRGTTTLEIAVPCQRHPGEELDEIASRMRLCGLTPETIVVSPAVDRQSTPPGSVWPECQPLELVYAAAAAAFPGLRLGGGMLSYFTELNRKRVPATQLDLVTHCTNPIVHAADDISVMQTLEALPFITRSVRALYGEKPYRIGPSTIAMRQNPYGSRTMDNPDGARMPMASTDPRHNGQFASAFAMGYAARVAPVDLDCLTLSALTGPFGLIAGPGEPMPEGSMRPLFQVVQALASLAGMPLRATVSSRPDRVMALATADGIGKPTVWLVNLTPYRQSIDVIVAGGPEDVRVAQSLGPFEILSVRL